MEIERERKRERERVCVCDKRERERERERCNWVPRAKASEASGLTAPLAVT